MVWHFRNNSAYTKFQHDFVHQRSCLANQLVTQECLTSSMDKGRRSWYRLSEHHQCFARRQSTHSVCKAFWLWNWSYNHPIDCGFFSGSNVLRRGLTYRCAPNGVLLLTHSVCYYVSMDLQTCRMTIFSCSPIHLSALSIRGLVTAYIIYLSLIF